MSDPNNHLQTIHSQLLPIAGDIVSAGAIIGAFAHMLPSVAALGAVVWYAVQIWDSRPVQTWLRLHRHKQRRKRTGRSGTPTAAVRHPRRKTTHRRHKAEPQGI